MKGFVQYLWQVFTSLYLAYLTIVGIAVAFFIWKHPRWEENVGIGWGPLLVVLVFFICALTVLWLTGVRLFTAREDDKDMFAAKLLELSSPKEDKNKFAGCYFKQGMPGREATISLVPGSEDWYTIEGGDWKGAGILDADRYYGIYWYKKTVDQHGTWGAHYGAFNAAAQKPFTFVRCDLHGEPKPDQPLPWRPEGAKEGLDSKAFYWTKA
jgi:hypothetical protein